MKNILICLFILTTLDHVAIAAERHGFALVDKICVVVEGESPILLSDIKRRSQQRDIKFSESENELIQEKLLWIYAKKQLKYNINEVNKSAEEHMKKVMESNHLNKEQFSDLLMRPPYSTTFNQFKAETATAILENQVKTTIAAQISISDAQVKEEAGKIALKNAKKYDIVFISVMPDKTGRKIAGEKPGSSALTAQFDKANEIRSQILSLGSLNEIKRLYERDKNISIIGPIAYKKGELRKAYDDRLSKEPLNPVTEPFQDDGSVTMIWRIKASNQNLDETALEKVRKELYDKAVMEKFKSVTTASMDSSMVIVKGCGSQ